MAQTMERVIILGCLGSGKTTFAVKMYQLTNLPLEHLDFYYHDDRYDFEHDRLAWREKVAALVRADRWIIEGNYKSSLDIRLPCADTVIFFDYPRHIVVWRALKRRLKYQFKRRPDMPPNWREKITPEFAHFLWQFNRQVRPRMHELLNDLEAEKTTIIFRRPADAQNYLESLSAGRQRA